MKPIPHLEQVQTKRRRNLGLGVLLVFISIFTGPGGLLLAVAGGSLMGGGHVYYSHDLKTQFALPEAWGLDILSLEERLDQNREPVEVICQLGHRGSLEIVTLKAATRDELEAKILAQKELWQPAVAPEPANSTEG